jgi:hypothetical protein
VPREGSERWPLSRRRRCTAAALPESTGPYILSVTVAANRTCPAHAWPRRSGRPPSTPKRAGGIQQARRPRDARAPVGSGRIVARRVSWAAMADFPNGPPLTWTASTARMSKREVKAQKRLERRIADYRPVALSQIEARNQALAEMRENPRRDWRAG